MEDHISQQWENFPDEKIIISQNPIFKPQSIPNFDVLSQKMNNQGRVQNLSYLYTTLYLPEDLPDQENIDVNTISDWDQLLHYRHLQLDGKETKSDLPLYMNYILAELQQFIKLGIYPKDANPALILQNSDLMLWKPEITLILPDEMLLLLLDRLTYDNVSPIKIVNDSLISYNIPKFNSDTLYYSIKLTLSAISEFDPQIMPYFTENVFFTDLLALLRPAIHLSIPRELTPRIPDLVIYQPTHV